MAVDGRWSPAGVVLVAAGLGGLVWLTAEVWFLVFAGILLAVGLDAIGDFLARHSPLTRGWAVAIAATILLTVIAVGGWLTFPMAFDQMGELWKRLDEIAARFRGELAERGVLRWLEGGGDGSAAQTVISHATGWAVGLLGGVTSLILILVIALFAVADPGLYRRGILRLLPLDHRPRSNETLSAIARALRWWFLGQLVSMAVLGVTVSVGLWIIGLDLWLALGLITAVLTFIPFLGPIIAGIPIVILGFVAGIQTGTIVLVFYLVVQNLEGNLLVPWIQQRAVDLPPVLLITVQVLLGTLFGVMGLIMAAPMAVVGMVAVRMLYVEDVLGDREDEHAV